MVGNEDSKKLVITTKQNKILVMQFPLDFAKEGVSNSDPVFY